MEIDQFIKTRPRLFHLTAASNLDRIRRTGGLSPASELYRLAGKEERLQIRRKVAEILPINDEQVHIRDNGPLHPGNMTLIDGSTEGEYIAYLNDHVFFWPGMRDGRAVQAGRNHFVRYADDECVVIEIQTRALFDANAHLTPLFCRYNSGAPRCITKTRKGAPRSRNMFVKAADFAGPPSDVKELTFAGFVALPWDAAKVRPVLAHLDPVVDLTPA